MGIEHVYVVYDPTRPFNRFDLGFRKVATSIELSHYEIFQSFNAQLQPLLAPLLLSIDEVEGNTTTIVHNATETLREKVFCVLGTLEYVHTPIHTHTFTPRHLSSMTVTLRTYDTATGTFKPVATNTAKVGLWFKIQTEDC